MNTHASAIPPSSLLPEGRTVFGLNPDWGVETLGEFAETTGVGPGAAVSFVELPWDEGDVENVTAAAEQIAEFNGVLMLTVEPVDGLGAVTPEVIEELVSVLRSINESGVPVLLRYAHEMNGSWYAWGQQPEEYVRSFREVAEAVQAAPATEMLWAPNYAGGYPYSGGSYEAQPGSADHQALDTDGDGDLTESDDPYASYYPGDDVVDWVGMTIYHWGDSYPWGTDSMPEPDKFTQQLTGSYDGLGGDDTVFPDFYTEYAVERDKPMAIPETAAFVSADADADLSLEIKRSWWKQVFSDEVHESFEHIRLISWFNWDKYEAEVDGLVRWSLTTDEATAEAFRADLPDWVLTSDDLEPQGP
ncbi:glycoside hydrolase family 26 protein [Nesterenkonia sp. NBAIMH1]|uniref:glycoside hydrolase family 26 protein n=1 Tax=Nesterenkonia sp. NBAIMH1 TaxID=2600320 RepID=UPI001FEE404B|nr:glycosyl hydrolase [Nesterenkonia sp. NBAIMH1]